MNIVNAVAFHALFQIIKRAFLPVSQLQIYTASLNDAIIVSTSYSCMLRNRLPETLNTSITDRSSVLFFMKWF